MTLVCDFSTPQDLSVIAQHCEGIIRYASDDLAKNITAVEFDAAMTLGLTVTIVCEQGNQPAMRGASGGLHDTVIANQQANAVGYDEEAWIYYVAEDPNVLAPSAWPTVVSYFQAVNANTVRPVGAYGGRQLLDHLWSLKLITRSWAVQTWGGASYADALQQLVGTDTFGLSIDVDQVLQADYGQHPRPEVIEYEEDSMFCIELADGKVVTMAIGAGSRAGQLLEFTRTPGDQTGASNVVIDVTDQIGTAVPYTVSA